jgi:hypothetical protein
VARERATLVGCGGGAFQHERNEVEFTLGRRNVPRFYLRNMLSTVRDARLREATIDLFDEAIRQAARNEVDICVLATCRISNVYYMLVEAGLPEIQCRIVTGRDFTLQVPEDEWEGKRVVILDDTVFLGSSLAYIVKDLRALVKDGKVTVNAICIDNQQSSPALIKFCGVSNALKRNTVETQRFSMELTTALHQALIPPMRDYFMSTRIELSTWRLDKILASDDWIRADVTCPAVAQSEVFSYSLFPRAEARRRIDEGLDAIVPKLSQFVAVAKLRAYGATSGNRALVRFVPVLVLKPFDVAIVSDALRSLQSRLKLRADFPVDRLSWDAQYRIMQLVLSAIVAREFHRSTTDAETPDFRAVAKTIVDVQALTLNFGAAISDFVFSAVAGLLHLDSSSDWLPIAEIADDNAIPGVFLEHKTFVESLLASAAKKLQHAFDAPHDADSRMIVRTGNDLVSEVAAIFTAIHDELEVPEEAEIRTLSTEEFFDKYSDRDRRKLSMGVSISGLANVVPNVEGELNRFALASLAIDICLDLGIIVPSTTYMSDHKTAVRLYHLGENSFFRPTGEALTYYPTTVSTFSQADALAEI